MTPTVGGVVSRLSRAVFNGEYSAVVEGKYLNGTVLVSTNIHTHSHTHTHTHEDITHTLTHNYITQHTQLHKCPYYGGGVLGLDPAL